MMYQGEGVPDQRQGRCARVYGLPQRVQGRRRALTPTKVQPSLHQDCIGERLARPCHVPCVPMQP
uniref:Uncharacterized protein n=1 Tax=Arundo donax TaxID=35708 RepID=A0A0A9AX47_ARUDO